MLVPKINIRNLITTPSSSKNKRKNNRWILKLNLRSQYRKAKIAYRIWSIKLLSEK